MNKRAINHAMVVLVAALNLVLMMGVLAPAAYAANSPRVAVVVNTSIKPSIQASLDQFVSDLESEGYSVIVYATEGGTPDALRTYLQNKWLEAESLVGCILVGDLPIAWYENAICSYPLDLFYMDMDGEWVDTEPNGKYDKHTNGTGDTRAEIWLGRLTASPLISEDEATLLNNYFDKNHTVSYTHLTLPTN